MRLRSSLALAAVLAGSMIVGSTAPSMAAWTVSNAPVTASATAGTLSTTLTGFAGLGQTYTPSSTSRTSTVTVGNTGTLAGTYAGAMTLGAGSSATMAAKVTVSAWPASAAACTVATPPAGTLSGTWAAFPAITGSLAPGASAAWCVRTTLATADQAGGTSVIPTYTLTLTAGTWAASAAESTTQTTPDITPPSVPSGLAATGTTSNATTVSWNASSDNVGVAGYKVYMSADGGATYTLVSTQTTLNYTATGLLPLRTYRFAVSAFDAAGNESARSTALSVTTLAPSATAWYAILNDKSAMCVDVEGGGTSPAGTYLIQYGCHGGTNQQFRFQSSGLITQRNNTALAWAVNGSAVGTLTTVENPSAGDIWQLVPLAAPSMSYQIKLASANRCISIVGGSMAQLARLELRTCDATSTAQTFTLQEVAP